MGPTWNENVIVIPHFTACDPRLPKYERVSMSVSNLWMQISANFSPLASSIGGLILGLTSASFMRLNGQIAGISGILKGASEIPRPSTWRLAFTSGIISSGVALSIFAPGVFGNIADLVLRSSPLTFGIAGLLVGFGSQMGSGCTSGHGICGLSRLSPRSIVAVGSFMVTGITTAVLRNLWFSPTDALDVASSTWPVSNELNPTIGIGMVSIAALLVTRFALSKLEPIATFPYTLSAYIHGAFFGLGLGVSGM